MKIIKEKISFIEAKALQSFLDSHNIAAHLSNEFGLDKLLGDIISVFVDEDDYSQALRLLSYLNSESSSEQED